MTAEKAKIEVYAKEEDVLKAFTRTAEVMETIADSHIKNTTSLIELVGKLTNIVGKQAIAIGKISGMPEESYQELLDLLGEEDKRIFDGKSWRAEDARKDES